MLLTLVLLRPEAQIKELARVEGLVRGGSII